jgi:hypothetical protein
VRKKLRKYLEWIFYVVCPNVLRCVSERAKTCVRTGLAESPCLQLCPDEHTDGTPRKSQILCVSGRAELVSIRDLQKVLICDSLNAHLDRLVLKLMSDDFG